jgi:hypothetical protein
VCEGWWPRWIVLLGCCSDWVMNGKQSGVIVGRRKVRGGGGGEVMVPDG